MKHHADRQMMSIADLIARQLALAEDRLRISLAELSQLDDQISKLVVDQARIVGAGDDLIGAFASLEARRRAVSVETATLKQKRVEVIAACDERRNAVRLLLRRKLALDAILSRLVEDEKARLRRG